MIEGKPVLRDGKPVTWCEELESGPEQNCDEILAKKKYVTDESGQTVLDEHGEPVLRHSWYEKGVGRGIGLFMLLMLCFGCYLLARMGAKWHLATAPPDKEKEEGT